jgi:hypothetical protein
VGLRQGLLPSAGRINNYRRVLPGALSRLEGDGLYWCCCGRRAFTLSTGGGPVGMGRTRGGVYAGTIWGKKVVVCTLYVLGGAAVGRAFV